MTNVGASFCKSLSSFKIQIHNNLTSKRKNPNEEHNKGYKTTNREIHKAIKRIEGKTKVEDRYKYERVPIGYNKWQGEPERKKNNQPESET
jgi:hypothetical protein